MILTSIALQNFRSYKECSFDFSPETTVIVGPNGAGKTNILEAIYLLATGKGFRAGIDREMISHGEELARVHGKLELRMTNDELREREEMLFEVVLTKGVVQGQKAPYKRCLINGVSKRLTNFSGNLRCVVFWPEDMELITRSPSRRRRYLDGILSQVDRRYHRILVSYEKGLRQRNRLLEGIRDGKARRSQLPYWDRLLITHGQYLTKRRKAFLSFINTTIIDGDEVFEAIYDHSIISEERLAKYAQQEVNATATLVGPHRDDFAIKIRNPKSEIQSQEMRDLRTFGSRGEQRLGVLWLKLAELAYIEEKTKDKPVLLLDDIFSELDEDHRKLVMEIVPKQQTIITTTDVGVLKIGDKKAEIITIDGYF